MCSIYDVTVCNVAVDISAMCAIHDVVVVMSQRSGPVWFVCFGCWLLIVRTTC